MVDFKNKSYEELIDLQRKSVPGGDIYQHLTQEIQRIQQDTNNTQIARLIDLAKDNERISIENSKSSKRFAWASLIFSIIAIYLSYVQASPVFQSRAREDRRSLSYCLQNTDSNWQLPDDSTTTCKNILRQKGYLLDQQFNIFNLISTSSTMFNIKNK